VRPENISPYDIYVVVIGDENIDKEALILVEQLEKI